MPSVDVDTSPAASPAAAHRTYDPAAVRELIKAQVSMVPDWRFAVLRLLLVAVLAVSGSALILTGNWWAAVVGVALMAVVYANLLFGQHECLHRGLFVHRWLNDAVGVAMGVFMGVPYAGYRRYHLHHHAHTHTEDDSEPAVVLTSRLQWGGYMMVAAHGQRFSSTMLLPKALTSRNRVSAIHAVASIAGLAVMLSACVYGVLYQPRLFLLGWLVPIVVGAPLMAYINMADHYGCSYGPGDSLAITRSTKGSRFTRFIAWDSNYHAEHHLAAAVPSSSLATLHRVLEPYVVHREVSFIDFHRRLLADLGAQRYVEPPPWAASRS